MALLIVSAELAGGGELVLRFGQAFGEEGMSLGREVETAQGERLAVMRNDYLVSGVRVRELGGEWRDLDERYGLGVGYVNGGKGEGQLTFSKVPTGEFDRLSFVVGLPPALNNADPNTFAADHPLHPGVNGLHWGWLGGYIYLALEGRYLGDDGEWGGFSYHLAGDGNEVRVEMEAEFRTDRDCTLDVEFDVGAVFGELLIGREGDSTHSREGDPVVGVMTKGLSTAFRVVGVSREVFQEIGTGEEAVVASGQQVYPLRIPERFPRVSLPKDNVPTVSGVALGRQLFHETLLSKGGVQSCASCHDPGRAFTEDRRFSVGVEGVNGRRNAMPLVNLVWEQDFFWDGRADTLREQVLMPIEDAHEMNESLPVVVDKLREAGWEERFEDVFGTPEVTEERLAKVLEQYLLTELSVDSRFDQAMRREVEFTEQEKRGFELFVTEHDPKRGLRGADCFHCHGGMLFTNHRFANNGLEYRMEDFGRFLVTGEEMDRAAFKVPTLRNVAVTGPYMHDGRFETLEEVIDHYDHGIHRSASLDPNIAKHPPEGLGLSGEDKAALVAFLKTLTDPRYEAGSGQELTDFKPSKQSPPSEP